METALDIAELVFRAFGIVGVCAAVGFGVALWRHNRRVKAHNVEVKLHNRKTAYLEDLKRWCPGAARAIHRHRLRSETRGAYLFDDDLFWRPPLVPGMATPYHAVCWADLHGDEVVADVHEIYDLGDPISTLRAALPSLGLGDQEAFLNQVWLLSPGTTRLPDVVRASDVTDPAEFARYKLAVLNQEESIIWVHRMEPDTL